MDAEVSPSWAPSQPAVAGWPDRPASSRSTGALAWETRGRALNPDWLAVTTAGAALGRPAIVMPRPPAPAELAGLRRPVLVVLAGRGRAHDPARVGARARALLPDVTVQVLAGAAHHSIPTQDAAELARDLAGFLGPAAPARAATSPRAGRGPGLSSVQQQPCGSSRRQSCRRPALTRSRPRTARST